MPAIDMASFEELYLAAFRPIYGFILARVHDQQTAEDLTSETFFKAQRSWPPRARDLAGRKAWLFEIARNAMRDHARGERRRPVEALEQAERWAVEERESDDERAERLDLRQALRALPERDQELLALRLAGFSNGEIGQFLQISSAAACMGIKRALERLAQRLEQVQ